MFDFKKEEFEKKPGNPESTLVHPYDREEMKDSAESIKIKADELTNLEKELELLTKTKETDQIIERMEELVDLIKIRREELENFKSQLK